MEVEEWKWEEWKGRERMEEKDKEERKGGIVTACVAAIVASSFENPRPTRFSAISFCDFKVSPCAFCAFPKL
jgi:hypothetical protein